MKRATSALAAALCLALFWAPAANADFGLKNFEVVFTNKDGSPATQAGSHPYEMTTSFDVNTKIDPDLGEVPVEDVKNITFEQIEGLVGNPTATPSCSTVEFLSGVPGERPTLCPDSTAVGTAEIYVLGPDSIFDVPVYNLEPPPGVAAKLGFVVGPPALPVTIEVGVKGSYPFNISALVLNTPEFVSFFGSSLTLWGNPSSSDHDLERGSCYEFEFTPPGSSCPTNAPEKPFLTLPRACNGPLPTTYVARSWQNPSAESPGEALVEGMTGCGKPSTGFAPTITAQATAKAASSPTGLDFSLDVDDPGLSSPVGIAKSDIRKAVVTLPEGMTANPSLAEGLEVCTEDQLRRETASSAPGAGCPEASKIGTVEVETPLLEGQLLKGSLFVAKPYDNLAGDSLIALYVVIKSPVLGIVVKQPLRVEPDPQTGQLKGIAEDIPQLPFSHFRMHFREGGRSPLINAPTCGTHTASAVMTPWSGGADAPASSSFQVISGPSEGPCPQGSPPFKPGFEAGSINNNAGSYSPFFMRWTRRDGDQDITRFSAKLPPGVAARLAGTTMCPQASIEAAKSKTGLDERANPSCPSSSKIGSVLAGAGAGSQLTYVPGSVYLAGPYKGAPLSAVGIVPAVAGPFDVGVVVTQQALRIDPRSAEVTADGSSSDPIPHILAGIPLAVRDIRVSVDKPDFTFNPTSCDPSEVGAELWGGGTDLFGSADDSPFSLASRFQAANCASLGFKPRLSLALKGGTKRGGHPALTGTYRPRAKDANLENLVLRLPRSAFLDQAHIRTICTRVQFAAKSCPPGAIYGKATAYTPVLDEPLRGPVYLRSSNHNLPDFVADLHGLVDVEAVARIDSKNGGIRATFEDVPDAPLSKVVVQMQGAKKGLIVNSRNLCGAKAKANAQFTGHNGKRFKARPVVKAKCRKAKRRGPKSG